MGCISCCLALFVITNLILFLVGGFMLATSLIGLFGPQLMLPAYLQFYKDLYNDVLSTSGDATVCYNKNAANKDDANLIIWWGTIPAGLFILSILGGIGLWFLFWAVWAFISLCRCCHKCFLVFYTIIQTISLIAFPVCYLLIYLPIFKVPILTTFGDTLNATMELGYGMDANDAKKCTAFKIAFDALQYSGRCCALNGYDPGSDARLEYSAVCSAGSSRATARQTYPGCWYVILHFLNNECVLWLGVAIGCVCFIYLLEIITAITCTGLWDRSNNKQNDDNIVVVAGGPDNEVPTTSTSNGNKHH